MPAMICWKKWRASDSESCGASESAAGRGWGAAACAAAVLRALGPSCARGERPRHTHAAFLHNVVKQLAARHVFHDDENVRRRVDHLVQADNVLPRWRGAWRDVGGWLHRTAGQAPTARHRSCSARRGGGAPILFCRASNNIKLTGCEKDLRLEISRRTFSCMSSFLILARFSTLMATFSPVRSCVASFTLPKEPMPSV